MEKFLSRLEAGLRLAKKLTKSGEKKPLVLVLPRGGIPMAAGIAQHLGAPLNILAVKKIGAPLNPEVAVGAVSEDGKPIFNEPLIARYGMDREKIQEIAELKTREVREQVAKFRRHVPAPSLAGQHIILVDDGLATGATMEAAVRVLRGHKVKSIHIAVPIASRESYFKFKDTVEELTTLIVPSTFSSVGEWYEDFHQVEDDEAIRLLRSVRPREPIDIEIERLARPLATDADLASLAAQIAHARIVMLGEATHGTRKFYEIRRKLSQILMQDHGFNLIAVEGDWPDCQELNKYIRNGRGGRAKDVMHRFRRWPTWMWANEETSLLIEWLRKKKVEFFGLDVYSLFESIEIVRRYAEKMHPETAARLMERYDCFEPFARNEAAYARTPSPSQRSAP
jgi:predicted phosphoribosyltransferase